jgi:CheY-like chemotaxis protein
MKRFRSGDGVIVMKHVVVLAGWVVVGVLSTVTSSAAAVGPLDVTAFSWTSLLLAALSFTLVIALSMAVWLGMRLRELLGRQREDARRNELLLQTVEQAPIPIVLFDGHLRVVRANAEARSRSRGDIRVGARLLDLEPGLIDHPLVAEMRSEAGLGESCPPVNGDAPSDLLLCRCSVAGESFLLWYGSQAGGMSAAPSIGTTGTIVCADESRCDRMQTDFIATITHEVYTPMNAIVGYAEMLARMSLGDKEKRYVAGIHKSSLALVGIFNDIMELSRVDSGNIEVQADTIRLATIIDDLERLFIETAKERGLRFTCRIAAHLAPAYLLDAVRLKQILTSLLRHAFKRTRDGGVSLQVDGMPSSGRPGCHDLLFIVRDSGPKLSASELDNFNALFAWKPDAASGYPYSNEGVGLTLSARLAVVMGGRIKVSRHEGAGIRFTVFLYNVPVALQDTAFLPSLPEQQVPPPAQPRKNTLLVVDDMDLIKDMFIDFFRNSPYTVLTASNGEDALALASEEQPGLIFMDLNMLHADGRQVAGQLRRQPETATIPVVVMTGSLLDESEYRPLFDDLLQKPFSLERLDELVRRFLPLDEGEASVQDAETNDLAAAISAGWTGELATLHRQALRSGSLSEAAELGAALAQRGAELENRLLIDFGAELRHFADELDIIGVDRLLLEVSKATQNMS